MILILLALGFAPGASASGRDCGNGPAVFPGNGSPNGGHFVRCSEPTPPTPSPEPSPDPAPTPGDEAPVVSTTLAAPVEIEVSEAPEKKVRGKRPRKIVRVTIVHPDREGGGAAGQLPKETAGFGVPLRWSLASIVLGLAAAIGVAIGAPAGPPPTFNSGGRP